MAFQIAYIVKCNLTNENVSNSYWGNYEDGDLNAKRRTRRLRHATFQVQANNSGVGKNGSNFCYSTPLYSHLDTCY